MVNCPIKQCGRKFQNEQTMLEHVRRRHPDEYSSVKQELTKSLIEKQHAQQQQLNKLPKLAKLMSRQKKQIQNPLKSNSKSKKIQGGSVNLSSIIQESRQITTASKNSIAARKPSLTKKISATNLTQELRIEKLPPLQKQVKIGDSSLLQKKGSLGGKVQATDQFYTTQPNFKTISGGLIKSRSKSKKKSSQKKPGDETQKEKQSAPSSATLRSTMVSLAAQKNNLQLGIDKKKTLLRPTKKVQKKLSDKITKIEMQEKPDFDQKIVNIQSWPESTFDCPSTSKIQMLFVNNCNLSNVILNSLQSLIQISLNGNKLRDMQFLRYQKNYNIKIIHIDHNQLTQIYTPPKLKLFTASFNKISSDSLHQVCMVLKKSPELQEVDFSFNNLRKAQNYKLRIIGTCSKIKKIDGLTVTKIDRDMFQQFNILQSKHKGLIPLGSPSDRPSTAVSEYESQVMSVTAFQQTQLHSVKSIAQLEKEQKQYEKLIQQTEEQLKIIKQQNEIIQQQLKSIKGQTKELESGDQLGTLFLLQKLQKQCEFLQLLNIMQYADEQQLLGMINKKKNDLGIPCE